MNDGETLDFQDHPFTCPYCGEETVVELPPQMETIMVGRETCENCGREFLIENDVPRILPQ
jgi:transcription elongation factor Elf1